MKKLLIVLGVVATFLATTAFVTNNKTNVISGSGDGVTTCEVYGADGYTATVEYKVITPAKPGEGRGATGSLTAHVRLNKENGTGKTISVVVQLRNSSYTVIESQRLAIASKYKSGSVVFDKKGSSGEVYYVTINSASCN